MKKVLSMFVVLLMSTMMWGASSSVPENAPDVMLQAFYWDSYPSNSSNLGYGNTGWSALLNQADELGEYFDLVWLPPCSQSSGGTGYIPKQYSNLNSDWGSETQLRELISKLNAKNTRCVADIVVNHITGNYGWCSFATMDFGDYGKFYPEASWICQTDEMNYEASAGTCQGKATGANDDGYGDEANYTAARDWDHKNSQVQAMCRAYLKWLKNDVGFDGWRYDYGKGFHHSHINDYNSAAGAYMSVVEYWDGNPGVIRSRLEDAQWNNMAFDFGTKYDAINNGICSFNYGKCKGAGMLGAGLKKHAVTFVDNHDTFQRNNSEFGGQGNSMLSNFKDRLLQANAYILSMPGIPCVFYPHWVTYKSEIKAMIEARHLVGVHSQSEVKDEYAEEGGYQATIVGKNGWLILQLGNKVGGSFDGFTKKASGNGYAMWIMTNTPVEHTYTVAGNSADVFGTAWAPSLEANDMIKQDDGSYKWEKSDLVLKAGTIELKVCEDHGWDVSYPKENYQLKIDAAGTYTITITFNAETKAISATATKTADADPGDEPGDDPQPVEKDSIFLVNAKAWATPTVHLWGGTAAGTTWPGVAMTKVNEKINGYDVYKYVADKGAYKNCIFNNAGADQTADLDWTSGKYYYIDKWYAKEDIPSSGDPGSGDDPQPAEKDSIFLVNAKAWATPTVHLWGGTAAGTTWPGVAMTKVNEKINGYDVYKYVADKGAYKNCIFNNAGADQTADLDWTSGKYYYIDKWYAKEDIPSSGDPGSGDDPQPAEKDSIFLVNAKAWATPTVHLWGGTAAGTTWPGVAMTKVNEKINGYDVYKYVADKGAYKNCIFNNAGADQTADLDWTSGKYYYIDKWYAKEDIPASGDPGTGDDPQPTAKFYITGDSALVVDAGLDKAKAWNPAAIKSEADTFELDLKADQYYVLKVTLNGTWEGENNIKGYNELTEKTEGLDDVSNDHNIGFKLSEAGKVQVIYTTDKDNKTIFKLAGKFVTEGSGSGDDPQPATAKFYITGDSALVVDAGLEKAQAWNPAAIKSEADTFELSLKADQYYVLKVTLNGTWEGENNVKGYNELTEKADGLVDDSNDHNIGFKLSEAGKVQVIYTTDKDNKTIFKLAGKFVTEGSGSGDDPQPATAKFYITGDSALVVDAGLDKAKAWNPAAIKSEVDTFELSLKADQYYVLKVTLNGTWEGENNVKGYNELTEKTEGLDDVGNDHNIGFKLSEAGKVQVIYTIKDNKTIFKLVGKFVTEGSGSGDDPQPVEKDSIFLVNAKAWATPTVHLWGGTAAGTTWPGVAMTKVNEKINGYDVYKYVADKGAYKSCIFNNAGADQTADLDWTSGKYYYIDKWYAKEDIPASGDPGTGDDPQPAEKDSIFLVNAKAWATPTVHLWGGTAAGTTWPGVAMTKVSEKINGYDVYKYVADKGAYKSCIFNNAGADQTADLDWTSGKYYYIDKWYAKEDIPSSGDPGSGDDPQPGAAKFYITGDSALVVDAGLEKAQAWNPAAIKSEKDTFELDLKADQYYVLKVTLNGTWESENNVKGYNELTEKADGLIDDGNDHNIGFKLSEAGKVQVIYTTDKDNKTVFKLVGKFVTEGSGSGDDPQPTAAKFYITGDSALVVDAGLEKAQAWNPAAIKSEKDTFELDLKADQYYVLKVTLNGTWEGENNVKGYNELTEKADGLVDDGNDHNIGFKLSEAGKVQVIYTTDKDNKTIFKLAGKFVTEGSGSGEEQTIVDGYYLMGTMNSWTPAAEYLFKANPDKANEYYLSVTLAVDDKLKVAKVEDGAAKTWYPDGMDNDYVVDAAHAGAKVIYFQTTYNAEWEAFGGYFYIASDTGTGLDNSQAGATYQKFIENGQLFILRDGRIYTPAGQFVR